LGNSEQPPPSRRVQWGITALDRVAKPAAEQLGFKSAWYFQVRFFVEKARTSFPVLGSSRMKVRQERWYCFFQTCKSCTLLGHTITFQVFTYQIFKVQ